MKAWKAALATLILYVVLVTATIAVAGRSNHHEVVSASRRSDVNSCIAANKAHDGVTKLVDQITRDINRSKTLTAAQKRARIVEWRPLLRYFPALDCKADPIVFR